MTAAGGATIMPARRIDEWFARYGASHRHPVNEAIHRVCIPLITWSVLGLLWAWSPLAAGAVIAASLAFYARLSVPIAVGMLAFAAVLTGTLLLAGSWLLPAAAAAFVVGWVAQFAGHRIEGRKPSTFEDLQFLLIAPAWLLAGAYRKLGIAY